MRTLYTKTLALLAVLFLTANVVSANTNNVKANNDDDKPKTSLYVKSKNIKNQSDFDTKIESTLNVLRAGYGKEVKVNTIGETTYYDFKNNKDLARLIVNNNEGNLKLIKRTLK